MPVPISIDLGWVRMNPADVAGITHTIRIGVSLRGVGDKRADITGISHAVWTRTPIRADVRVRLIVIVAIRTDVTDIAQPIPVRV